MFTSVGASAVCLIAGIIIFIVLCFKGLHTALAALIGAMVVALGATDGWTSAIFTAFPSGMGAFISNNALVFISSGIFAFVMRETKSGESVANKLVHVIGAKHAPYAIILVVALLQLGGINTYLFIVAPLCYPLMKAADLPFNIAYAAAVSAAPIVSFCLPGVTSMANILASNGLGTSLYAAPVLSILCAIIGTTLALFYIRFLINRARRLKLGYVEPGTHDNALEGPAMGGNRYGEIVPPSFLKGILPVFSVFIFAGIFQLVLKINAMQAASYAMWLTVLLVVLMNWKVCIHKIKLRNIIGRGGMDLAPFMVMAACVFGFGSVTQASACFEPLKEMILSIDVNPYFTAWLSIALIAGLCADGIGGLSMWLSIFGPVYTAMPGINLGALHRILVSASVTLDSLPHSAQVATGISLFKTSYKESYVHTFVLTVLIPIVFSLTAVVVSILLYSI